MQINILLNSKKVSLDVAPDMRLVDLLRNEFNLLGTKEGCGEGECGACTVLLDDEPIASCLLLACQAHNRRVETIEGISDTPVARLLINAFKDNNAVQCGFCFPGIMMSSYHYLLTDGDNDAHKIKNALSGNICRCTGYKKIIEAVQNACEGLKKAAQA